MYVMFMLKTVIKNLKGLIKILLVLSVIFGEGKRVD